MKHTPRILSRLILTGLLLVGLGTVSATAAETATTEAIVHPAEVGALVTEVATLRPVYDENMDPNSAAFSIPDLPAGSTLSPDRKSVVITGVGTWSVNQGTFKFQASVSRTVDPAPMKYVASTLDGTETAAPATLSVYYPHVRNVHEDAFRGRPVALAPQITGKTDPASVRVLNPETGQPSTALTIPGQGTWSVGIRGVMTFTPAAELRGDPTPVLYSAYVTNYPEASAQATASVTYRDLPDLSVTEAQGKVATLKLNGDFDLASARLIDPGTQQPTTASVVVPGQGTWSSDPGTSSIKFAPAAGFNGDPTPAKYTARPVGGGAYGQPATLTVLYPDVSSFTRVWRYARETVITTTGTTGMWAQPRLIDRQVLPSSLTLIDGAGTPVDQLVVEGQGYWAIDDNGSIHFTPRWLYRGAITPVRYLGYDADGHPSLPGTVTMLDAYVPNLTVVGKGTDPANFPLMTDPNMTSSTTVLIDPVTGARTSRLVVPNQGTWLIGRPSSGYRISFTPDPGFTGKATPIQYTMSSRNETEAKPGSLTVSYP